MENKEKMKNIENKVFDVTDVLTAFNADEYEQKTDYHIEPITATYSIHNLPEKYQKLKKFIKEQKLNLFPTGIDLWYECFEIAICSDKHFNFTETIDVYNYFNSKGFDVYSVQKRISAKQYGKYRNKKIYVIRLDSESSFFNENEHYEIPIDDMMI